MINGFFKRISLLLPYRKSYLAFASTKQVSSYLDFLLFRIVGKSRYWPVDKRCIVANPANIFVGINAIVGRPGNYIQGAGGVYIGDYVNLAPNVGILSANHDLYDQNLYNVKKVVVGDYSWIGMNSVVLPGVVLGTRTIVGAGSVVTKSFPEGFCVIAGNPAKLIKRLDPSKFRPWRFEFEYYGYITRNDFEKKRDKYIVRDLEKL